MLISNVEIILGGVQNLASLFNTSSSIQCNNETEVNIARTICQTIDLGAYAYASFYFLAEEIQGWEHFLESILVR